MTDAKTTSLIYDDSCLLCKNLAVLVGVRDKTIRIVPWSQYDKTSKQPIKLTVIGPEQKIYQDEQAFAFLLENHKDLRSLAWLAEKLGFREKTAKLLATTSSLFRKGFCIDCWKANKKG